MVFSEIQQVLNLERYVSLQEAYVRVVSVAKIDLMMAEVAKMKSHIVSR